MATGQKVPDEVVDDLLAEAMVAKVDKAKVSFLAGGLFMPIPPS